MKHYPTDALTDQVLKECRLRSKFSYNNAQVRKIVWTTIKYLHKVQKIHNLAYPGVLADFNKKNKDGKS